MSKITPKNLHYDSTLPPFLARLQANNDTRDGRNEFNVARPKKARNAEDEAEDEPVYFNEESGETLTKTEWEAKEAADEAAQAENPEAGADTATAAKSEGVKEGKEKIAGIGATKKRKAGKVVGGEGEEEEEEEPSVKIKKEGQTKAAAPPKGDGKKGEKPKPMKKAKKIKLSFDE